LLCHKRLKQLDGLALTQDSDHPGEDIVFLPIRPISPFHLGCKSRIYRSGEVSRFENSQKVKMSGCLIFAECSTRLRSRMISSGLSERLLQTVVVSLGDFDDPNIETYGSTNQARYKGLAGGDRFAGLLLQQL
jgi:hypothetical protein